MYRDLIKKALQEITGLETVQIDVPVQESFGDYSSNVVMTMFAKIQDPNSKFQTNNKLEIQNIKTPRELAESLVRKLQKDSALMEVVEKIEIAGPGFLNFWVKKEALLKAMTNAKLPMINEKKKGKKIMFEFGQPNTHKLPHIGHLFSYVFGSAMTNILEASGNELYRVNYQGDVGPHVAKALWSFKNQNPIIPEDLEGKVELLQKMYQDGTKAGEEDEETKKEIIEINKMIYAKDPSIMKLWEETRTWSIEYYKLFEKRLGIHFDRYYLESEVFQKGKDLVESNIGSTFKESQDAIIFEGSNHGLHDRVFVTRHGTATYEAKDLALEKLKMEEWPADLLIITTANEQNEYFKVIFKALETLDPSFRNKLKHIGFGMVQLKTGKMSSRTGQIISAIDLVNLTIEEVKKFVENREELNSDEKNDIAEKVGLGAIKYTFLKSNPLQNISFDMKESISIEGNSGPYLQYTFARMKSVLVKSNLTAQVETLQAQDLELNVEELSLLRTLSKFDENITDAAETYSPNILCNYLYELAQKFNTFYNKHRILEIQNPNVKIQKKNEIDIQQFRLALTQSTAMVLQNGLHLLGIETPEKM